MSKDNSNVKHFTYDQAEQYARGILNQLETVVRWKNFAALIGIPYPTFMIFKNKHRDDLDMPIVVNAILEFAFSNVDYKKEYIYSFEDNKKDHTLKTNTYNPANFINNCRIPSLMQEKSKIEEALQEKSTKKLQKELEQVDKKIASMKLFAENPKLLW